MLSQEKGMGYPSTVVAEAVTLLTRPDDPWDRVCGIVIDSVCKGFGVRQAGVRISALSLQSVWPKASYSPLGLSFLV